MFENVFVKVSFFIFIGIFIIIYTLLLSEYFDINNKITKYNYYINKFKTYNDKDLCTLFNCQSIFKDNTLILYDKGNNVLTYKYKQQNFHFYENIYFDVNNNNINIFIKDKYIYINLLSEFEKETYISVRTIPVIILIIIIYTIIIIKIEGKNNILITAANSSLIQQKSTMMFSENIHHELNTPLDVISNKVHKVHKFFDLCKKQDSKIKSKNLDKDFGFIYTSLLQISNILDKMKAIKNVKYNVDESIGSVLENSAAVLQISDTDFKFELSTGLNNFILNTEKLTNSDLTNIFLNHIKNSLEANANIIIFNFEKYSDNMLSFSIVDNGSGIDDKDTKYLFEPNFSTKKEKIQDSRGFGMYFSKHMIGTAGGTISIENLKTESGTKVSISLPAKPFIPTERFAGS